MKICNFFKTLVGEVLRHVPTYGCDKVLVTFKCLSVPLALDVPNSDGLIVGNTKEELSAGMERKAPHPVIMTNLQNAGIFKRHLRAPSG